MSRALRHLALFGMSLPSALLGYHVLAGGAGDLASAEGTSQRLADLVATAGGQHSLAELALLERNLYYVEQRYVDQDRVDFDAMFSGSLERVERSVAGVMFVRQPSGKRLQVSIGTYDTVLFVETLDDFDALYRELRRVAVLLEEHLPGEVDRSEVEYDLINGALSTLDPHSLLLPPVAAREMEVDNQGEFGGLGIEIHIRDGLLTVKQPLEGTPAERAGMRAGDQIVRIEDESTVNMDLNDAVGRLRGEVGSPVRILVKRKQRADPLPMTIVRDRIKLNPVEGKLLQGDVGYVRIKSFHGNVAADLEELLARLHRESADDLQGLVLDLRGNPGGYLNQAVAVSDRFVSEGVIVATEEGGGRREEQRATRAGTESDYPVAVLVNGSSASASEIVAGALRNLGRGVIVGERTFGKGSVQHLYPNRDDSTLKLTVARYLTPGDHSIQAIGIPPDVLLQPSVVREPAADSEDTNPVVSLYWREWIEREADLDHALGNREQLGDAPAFSIRFLRPAPPEAGERSKPEDDWEVDMSRALLAAADGPSRIDVLRSAGDVLGMRSEIEEARIGAAFGEVGIDWTPGDNPARAQVDAHLALGADELVRAGQAENVVLSLTNTSSEDLWQLSAVTDSDNPWLDDREFYFGHLAPGETREARLRVVMPEGAFDEHSELELTLRDPDNHTLARWTERFETRGQDLPAFAYKLRLIDDGSQGTIGDGDGLPEVGETVALELVVENTGEGVSRDGFVRLRNRSGRPLDLDKGTFRLGTPELADGTACDPEDHALTDCSGTLRPGESHTGTLLFALRDAPEDAEGWAIELSVGDNERYDWGSVVRGGFYEFFRLEEELALSPGQPVDEAWRRPPAIELTRTPDLVTDDAVISGMVRDDTGVRDVVIFHGDEKVFYRGGVDETLVPFTVQPQLAKGGNLVVVLARDAQGLTATRSLSVWNPAQALSTASRAEAVRLE